MQNGRNETIENSNCMLKSILLIKKSTKSLYKISESSITPIMSPAINLIITIATTFPIFVYESRIKKTMKEIKTMLF